MVRKSHKISNPFVVGLFVLIGFITIAGLTIWLGASKLFIENTRYVTYFSTSIEGLEKGSPVKYLGMPVGSVERIGVAPDGKLMEVVILISKDIKIDTAMRIKAEMSGIAGGKFLQLQYLEDKAMSTIYPHLSFKPALPLIKSAPSGIEEITLAMRETLNKLMQFRYKDVSEEMISFLQTSSRFFENDKLYEIVSQVDDAMGRVVSILNRADTSNIIDNLSFTSQKLLMTSKKLEHFADSLNSQIDNLQLNNKVNGAFARFDSVMLKAKDIVDILGYRLEMMTYSSNEAINSLSATNKELRKTLRKWSDNPGQLLLSEPPPKEK